MKTLSEWVWHIVDWLTGATAIRESYRRKEATLDELTQKYLDAYKDLEKDKKDWEEKEKSELIKKAKEKEAMAKHYERQAELQVYANNSVIHENKSLLEKNIRLEECLQAIRKTIANSPIVERKKSNDYVQTYDERVRPFEGDQA